MTDSVMQRCLAVGPADRVLVVADTHTRELGTLFFSGALRFTREANLIVMPPTARDGAEPPSEVAAAMCAATVCLLPVSKSLTHTHARKAASSAGARVASMPSITYEMAMRTMAVDYHGIARVSRLLADRITQGRTVRLTAPAGTDLTFSVAGRTAHADTGVLTERGRIGNLPAGEAFVAPLEGTAEGTLVIDAASLIHGAPVDPPMLIAVRGGVAREVTGAGAPELERIFREVGDGARNIAELGIGTNPAARVTGNVLESEKVVGTAHVALGNNFFMGGTVDVPFHSDGVIARPTIAVDGRPLMIDGRFADPA